MNKYDLVEKRMHAPNEVLADLIGAELHERCDRFPPAPDDVEWLNPAFERRFKHNLKDLPPPDSTMIAFLARILDLEIDHEIEEIDRLMKDEAYRICCPTPLHVETLHFLWQLLIHHLEERAIQMSQPFKRQDKHRVVDSLRKRVMLVRTLDG